MSERTSHTAVYQDTYGDGDNHTEEDEEEDRETHSQTYYYKEKIAKIYQKTFTIVYNNKSYMNQLVMIITETAVVFITPIKAIDISITNILLLHTLSIITLGLVTIAIA